MKEIKAVIFDMDGVLIDSEPLWRKSMIQGFNEIGIPFTEADCRTTTGMRFNEVIQHWFTIHSVKDISPISFSELVINYLIQHIQSEGKAMDGALALIQFLEKSQMPIGLATSSSQIIVDAVMDKLKVKSFFHAIVSAEFLKHGKPHPEVYLSCAESLNVNPKLCLAIEDSINGIIAAKAAQMKVIAIPDEEHQSDHRFNLADYKINTLKEVIKLF